MPLFRMCSLAFLGKFFEGKCLPPRTAQELLFFPKKGSVSFSHKWGHKAEPGTFSKTSGGTDVRHAGQGGSGGRSHQWHRRGNGTHVCQGRCTRHAGWQARKPVAGDLRGHCEQGTKCCLCRVRRDGRGRSEKHGRSYCQDFRQTGLYLQQRRHHGRRHRDSQACKLRIRPHCEHQHAQCFSLHEVRAWADACPGRGWLCNRELLLHRRRRGHARARGLPRLKARHHRHDQMCGPGVREARHTHKLCLPWHHCDAPCGAHDGNRRHHRCH